MAQKRQPTFFERFIASRILTAVLLVVILFLAHSVYNRYVIERDMAERRAAAEIELLQLEERHEALRTEVEYLSNERGIEAEMRRQFDVAREGEQVVIILEDDAGEREVAEVSTSTPAETPWYRFWH